MTGSAPVTVVIDGRLIPSSHPPAIVGGTVVAPVDPFVRSLAATIGFDEGSGTITIARGPASIVVKLGQKLARLGPATVMLPIAPYLREGSAFIPLAAVARELGAAATFDGRSKTLWLTFAQHGPLATPSPYVPAPDATSPLPFRVDPTAAPRPTVSGIPQPRRTPIEVAPRR